MGADKNALILLLIVLVADALLAELPVLRIVLALPRVLVGQMGGWFDRKPNREERSVANRLLRGALAVCAIVVLAFIAGHVIQLAAGTLPNGWMIEAAAIACLIGQTGWSMVYATWPGHWPMTIWSLDVARWRP